MKNMLRQVDAIVHDAWSRECRVLKSNLSAISRITGSQGLASW